MKRIAILIGLLIALPACEDEAPPVAQQLQQQTAEQAPPPLPPPPPSYEFPVEENAFSTVQAFTAIPIGASFVVATANSEKMWELFDAAEPEIPEYTPARGPELLDLHPTRLAAIGVDPKRPVGIAIYGEVKKPLEGDQWAIFGTLKDREKFRDAFKLRDVEGKLVTTQEKDQRNFVQFDNGEFIITSKVKPQLGEDRGKVLGEQPLFIDWVEALDYGTLGTAYINTKRGTGIYGVGFDENGLGVKAIADDDIFAARLRLNFAHYAADLWPQVPYLNRVINLRGELHTSGRQMRQEITDIDVAPRKRRAKAAKQMMHDVEVAGELETNVAGHNVQGRVWKVSAEDIADAYQGWVDLGPTPAEIQKREHLATSLAGLEVISQMDVDEMSQKFIEEGEKHMGKPESMEKMLGMGGPMTDAMMKLGGVMVGKPDKGKKGKDGKSEAGGPMGGIMKGLGGVGGFLGGGGGSDADVRVFSKVRELRRHMQRKRQTLAICWGKIGLTESFDMRLDLESDVEGRMTIHSLRGGPDEIRGCVRNAVGPRGPKPKPDPDHPDAGIESLRGVVTLKFTM